MTPADPEAALAPLRDEIDVIDDQLVGLLAKRMICVRHVIEVKRRANIPARIASRVEEVVGRVKTQAERVGAPPELAELLWRRMIEWVIGYEERTLGSLQGGLPSGTLRDPLDKHTQTHTTPL